MHLHGETPADHLTLPLYPLAEGLIYSWWSLFGGRDCPLSLMRHRGGFALPDVRMSFDGAAFEIGAWQRTYTNPAIRFWSGPSELLGRAEAEARLSEFVELVLERLGALDIGSTSAALRWERVKASLEDQDEKSFCESAGALQLDPYEISDDEAETIDGASEIFTGEPLAEFLSGARSVNRPRLIKWVRRMKARPGFRSLVADLQDVAKQVAVSAPPKTSEQAWALGYRRARATRLALGLNSSRRIGSVRDLAELFGAGPGFDLAPETDGIQLLREDRDDGVHLHLRKGRTSRSDPAYLFTFARGVGDALCFPDPDVAPVNELHFAYRQASGRAFAAEFLAPVEEVSSMQADGHDSFSIAGAFGVGTQTIALQLENRGRILEVCK
ncbi:hypothetical protein ACFOGJ_21710 [Marinibaculum pumilum]|uniref:Uncharacterized protein n=1 Tax=Marinibaculum pumilum TaxID=1766165 RepID=A0ABV7L5K1_9PROT